jgi:hypothetical protein
MGKKWAAEWTAAGGWLVYLGTADGAFHDVKLEPEREADAKLTAKAATLRNTLESRSVVLMGPHSPFWRCEYCSAMQTTPINFPHTPDCLLHYEFTYGDASQERSAT